MTAQLQSGIHSRQGRQLHTQYEANKLQRRIYGLTLIRVKKLEPDAVKVARPVLMNRGWKSPSDSRFIIRKWAYDTSF